MNAVSPWRSPPRDDHAAGGAAAVAWMPAAARADGDPGSDVLVYQPLFVASDAGVSLPEQIKLGNLLRSSAHSGVADPRCDHLAPQRPRRDHRSVASPSGVRPLSRLRAVAGLQGRAARRHAERLRVQLARPFDRRRCARTRLSRRSGRAAPGSPLPSRRRPCGWRRLPGSTSSRLPRRPPAVRGSAQSTRRRAARRSPRSPAPPRPRIPPRPHPEESPTAMSRSAPSRYSCSVGLAVVLWRRRGSILARQVLGRREPVRGSREDRSGLPVGPIALVAGIVVAVIAAALVVRLRPSGSTASALATNPYLDYGTALDDRVRARVHADRPVRTPGVAELLSRAR